MSARRALAATALLLLTACASSRGPRNVPPPDVGQVTALPDACGQLAPPRPGGEVGFVVDGRVYVVSPATGRPRCVAESAPSRPISWSPQADSFLLAGPSSVEVIGEHGQSGVVQTGAGARLSGFSRPTGRWVVYVPPDGASVVKAPATGGAARGLSFLTLHQDVAYHPSGAQIAAIGTDDRRHYGIYLASNGGRDLRRAVWATAEESFGELVYSYDGSALYYTADEHDGSWEVMHLDLSVVQGHHLDLAARSRREKVASAPAEIAHLYPSPLSPTTIAYQAGGCTGAFQTFVRDDEGTHEIGDGLGDTTPLGWLPDGTLVVGASDDLCAASRTLDVYVANADALSRLVGGADYASVRAVAPPPPPVPAYSAGDPAEE